MLTQPSLAIFRIPDGEDGAIQFVQLIIDDVGQVDDEGLVFTVPGESSYNEMTYSHIVLATATENGSHSLNRYFIVDDDQNPATVCEMEGDELSAVIKHLINDYLDVETVVLH